VSEAVPFFTIGHSARPLAAFLALLAESRIGVVADVRAFPRSRANPQFNGEALAEALPAAHVSYDYIPELGGRRGRQGPQAASPNGLWENRSFRNYGDYALTAPFRAGLARLLELEARRCAVMCAEAVWWRCHRRIIADYLIAQGRPVIHILGPGHSEPARLTPGAVIGEAGVTYPAAG
jgi:uncharacterized protein (DUF488 family)